LREDVLLIFVFLSPNKTLETITDWASLRKLCGTVVSKFEVFPTFGTNVL